VETEAAFQRFARPLRGGAVQAGRVAGASLLGRLSARLMPRLARQLCDEDAISLRTLIDRMF